MDAEHDLVFVPTGSAAPDYFGGIRKGDDKWANSVVALRASTGEFVWGFQVVHHDLWDYDVAAQPSLINWKDGTPAVVINTKMGHVFVLNRLTGAPLLPIQERHVPQSDIDGEESSPTQPFSTISLVPEKFEAADAWGPKPDDAKWCQEKIAASRNEGIFTPPSLRGTVQAPGNVGGVNWGSAAFDPQHHLMIVNTNRLIAWVKLIPRANYAAEVHKDQDNRIYGEFGDQQPSAYGLYRTFLFSPSGTPCNRPPWGTTEAVDLFTGKIRWDVPLGTMVPGTADGLNQPRRANRDSGWVGIFLGDDRSASACIRFGNGQRIVELRTTRVSQCHAHDLHLERQAVSAHLRRRPRQVRLQARRLRYRFFLAIESARL